MKKTMIYLEDEQFVKLKKVVSDSNKKMSEIIREALANYLKTNKKKVDYFSFVGIAEGPQNGKTSEEAEEMLREVLK